MVRLAKSISQSAVTVLSAFSLIGCGCRDCAPTWEPTRVGGAANSKYEGYLAAASFLYSRQSHGSFRPAIDPGTILGLISQLAAQSDYVGKLIGDASQELQNVVSDMQKSVQIVLNDLDGMMKDHEDRIYKDLNALEKQTYDHALLLSQRMAQSIQALEVSA